MKLRIPAPSFFGVTVASLALAASALLLVSCAGASAPKAAVSANPNPASSGHVVDLSWAPSSSGDVSGYNVYRAPYSASCGSFSKLNTAPLSSTVYTDFNVTPGASYCYATTAVSASNTESKFSNVVSNIQIPQP